MEIVFVDMDGVLTEFVVAAAAIHQREPVRGIHWVPGRPFHECFGLGAREFWAPIDAAGAEFWAGLAPTPWFHELLAAVTTVAPLMVLTSATSDPGSLAGKVRWMQEHLPRTGNRPFGDYMIGHRKHLLAKPGRLLIDDADENVDQFRSMGGDAILLPQPWNRDFHLIDRMDHLRLELGSRAGEAADGSAKP